VELVRANVAVRGPRAGMLALTNATLPYVLELAGAGLVAAVRHNPALAKGVNIWRGHIAHPAVAEALGEPATPLDALPA